MLYTNYTNCCSNDRLRLRSTNTKACTNPHSNANTRSGNTQTDLSTTNAYSRGTNNDPSTANAYARNAYADSRNSDAHHDAPSAFHRLAHVSF